MVTGYASKATAEEALSAGAWQVLAKPVDLGRLLPLVSEALDQPLMLVVDDDPLVLTNMAAMLEDLGHTVHEASSALEALSILGRESAIELVLTDQAMPQRTGAELIGEIKCRWPTLPIILATGFAELPPGIEPSQQITLKKPFLQYDLEQAVNAALEDPKQRRVVGFRGGC